MDGSARAAVVVTRAALFSGGDDSLAATTYAFEHDLADVALHIDTTIAAPATRAFVETTCAAQGWPLLVYSAPVTSTDKRARAEQHLALQGEALDALDRIADALGAERPARRIAA